MNIAFLLAQPFAQHALLAAALVAVSCGLIGPFVVTRGMAFAVHGTAELAFTGAAAGLIVAGNPVAGALAGSLVVAALIATLGARPRERDSAIGAILAFGMGIGVLLLGFYQGFATAATNILFGNIFGVSGTQLLILVAIGRWWWPSWPPGTGRCCSPPSTPRPPRPAASRSAASGWCSWSCSP